MTKEDIELQLGNEERIFPFYNGVYMGEEGQGFSNIKSAKKYMRKIPQKEFFWNLFGSMKEYYRRYGFLHKLNNNKADYSNKYFFKDMSEEEFDRIYSLYKTRNNSTEFENNTGYYCYIFEDDKEWSRIYGNYIKDRVEFKKGIVDVKIRWVE